jgi:uncharacterized protein
MKRDVFQKLFEWKNAPGRKPLIVRGARQVGKTYLLKEFGKTCYEQMAYFNFEQDPNLQQFFSDRLEPAKIIEKLSIYREQKITPETTLIVFDEIQEAPLALTSLKYFNEQAGSYHLVAAGSLLGIKVGRSTPFPVGKVSFLDMHPLSFGEYLEGIGKPRLRELLEATTAFEPLDTVFHNELIDHLKMYYFIGGMPEAIVRYKNDGDFAAVRAVQQEILAAYEMDFAKHASKTEALKITSTWNSLPAQLSRENKKFKFSEISKNARSRDFHETIQWLVDAGLAHRCCNIRTPRLPLSGYREEGVFKLYILDTGLLCAMLDISQKTIVEGNRLFAEYNGAVVENYVAQQLIAGGLGELYYWTGKTTSEVDFIITRDDQVLPLEVKAGTSTRKKSLLVYGDTYNAEVLLRATLMNFKKDGRICNYPLYAVSLVPRLR